MKTCPTHKKVYTTEAVAEEALIAAWITYRITSGAGPISIYHCDDCGGYHLTSKGQINKKLQEHLDSGKIAQGKEAQTWLLKLKHKGKLS